MSSTGTPAASQPTPVVDNAATAAAVSAAVVGLLTLAATLGLDIETATRYLVAGAGAVGAIVTAVSPLLAARRAAKQVTPVASPQDDAGRELVPLDDIDRGLAGQVGAGVLDEPDYTVQDEARFLTATVVPDEPT